MTAQEWREPAYTGQHATAIATWDLQRTQEIVYCGMFAALMAAGAMIKIMLPIGIYEVTISLQLFAAILAGFLLGARRGSRAVMIYLLIGLVGVPVFAHGGGLGYLLKPTFGFLIGFAGAAWAVGQVRKVLGRMTLARTLIAGIAGEMVYYACGLAYYYVMFNWLLPTGRIGMAELFSVWFLPTVIPDLAITVLASTLALQLLPRIGLYDVN